MTDLPARLAAIGMELPEVDEYRRERLRRGPDVDGLTADAALAAVVRELEQYDAECVRLREKLFVCEACHEPITVRLPNRTSDVRENAHRANIASLERCWHDAEAALKTANRLNAMLIDEKTQAVIRSEKAEAERDVALQQAALMEGWTKSPDDVLHEVEALMQATGVEEQRERAEKAEAEVARLITSEAALAEQTLIAHGARAEAEEQLVEVTGRLRQQIAELEAENERLRNDLPTYTVTRDGDRFALYIDGVPVFSVPLPDGTTFQQVVESRPAKDAIIADLKRIVGQQEQELHEAEEVLRILAHAYTMSEQEAQNAIQCARMIAADDAGDGGRP
jgi:hypothetical protein